MGIDLSKTADPNCPVCKGKGYIQTDSGSCECPKCKPLSMEVDE